MDSSTIQSRLNAKAAAARGKGISSASGQAVFNSDIGPFITFWWGSGDKKMFQGPTIEDCISAAEDWVEGLPTTAEKLNADDGLRLAGGVSHRRGNLRRRQA